MKRGATATVTTSTTGTASAPTAGAAKKSRTDTDNRAAVPEVPSPLKIPPPTPASSSSSAPASTSRVPATPQTPSGLPQASRQELEQKWKKFVDKHNEKADKIDGMEKVSEHCELFDLHTTPPAQPGLQRLASDSKVDPIWVVSCDGGGVRGAATAAAVQAIEEMTDRAGHNIKLGNWDIFAGTSTGSFVSGMLAACSASGTTIVKMYTDQAQVMMPPKNWLHEHTHAIAGFFGAVTEFDNEGKELVLKLALQKFADGTQKCMSHCTELGKQLLVVAYQIGADPGIRVFDSEKDPNVEIWQACNASSAAPVYYKACQVGTEKYIDGGVVLNNPIFTALTAADALSQKTNRPVRVLSIGTGSGAANMEESVGSLQALGDGIMDFITESSSQNSLAERFCQMKGWRFLRVDGPLGQASKKMEDVSPANILALIAAGRSWVRMKEPELRQFFR